MTDFRSVEAAEFRLAMRNLASGVAIVATGRQATRRGLTVSSVTSLCMEPPCLLVGINASSESHAAILANGCFGISLLGSGQEDLALRFAGGAKGIDRFGTARWVQGMLDVPLLEPAIGTLECVLHHHQVVGTHGLFIGRIVATSGGNGDPLVNFRGALRALLQA
ncbi:flavin reductase family protein [Bradyrhizobium sp. GCM10027634]|uniref:flavin reductase family protein n=1 Tax=unclassified Bradyrhizobium TaxID=2631580 RepID=UPI00263BAC12|nr:flavin reductase family protein [Bradyrhizobium sp. WYCCWR 12677]MDN5004321.1 flavin reductase family protein [Bradyrhizobium sp. WYCCWR 12677]